MIDNRKITGQFPNISAVNETLLNISWVKINQPKEIIAFFEQNNNKNTIYHNVEDIPRAIHRENL